MCFCFTSNEKCHFSSEKRLPPKTSCDFPRERDTFRNKSMEIVEDFDEKSYNNNNGKSWKSSRILRVNPFFHFFFLFSSFFLHFSVFFHLSFFSFFTFFHFFIFFHSPIPSNFHPPSPPIFHFSPFFYHFLSFSLIFCHFLSFSFNFCHFLSFSFIFSHFLSFSFIFLHFPSFLFL